MAITVGRHMPPAERVSVAHAKSSKQIEFDHPRDFMLYVQRHDDFLVELLNGEWEWTTQPIQGGS
jgi:hypothetical protein